MVGSGRCLLRACVLVALMAAVGGNQRQQQALLQGAQDQVVMRGVSAPEQESMLGKRSPAEREEYISQIEDAEFAAMRDMMAVSQALQGVVSPRVKVEVYTAAGCGECRKVFHAAIAKVLQKEGMLNIVDLNMVLWGDGDVLDPNGAKVSMTPDTQFPPTVSFSCRTHGDQNCDGNAWESCLMSKYPDEGAYFPVLNCIEGRACADFEQAPVMCYGAVPVVGPVCAKEFGEGVIDPDLIKKCAEGPEGQALLLANAKATAALDPPMTFLPWIIVQGKALGSGEGGKDELLLLGKAICDAYASLGGVPPFSCTRFPQALDDLNDPWGIGPTTDDTIGVPLIRSEDPAAINVAILVFLLMLACALAFGCCFCEPRAEDEHLFDALGGRPFRTLLN